MRKILTTIVVVFLFAQTAMAGSHSSFKTMGNAMYPELLNHTTQIEHTMVEYSRPSDILKNYTQEDTGTGKMGDYIRFGLMKKMNSSVSFGKPGSYKYTFKPTYKHTLSQEKWFTNKINAQKKSIKGSKYKQVKTIYKKVIKMYKYKLHQGDAFTAMKTGRGNCTAYATTFYRLCRAKGIPCRIVGSESHTWNIVKLGKYWYHADTSGDDTGVRWGYFLNNKKMSGNKYRMLSEFRTSKFKKQFPVKAQY